MASRKKDQGQEKLNKTLAFEEGKKTTPHPREGVDQKRKEKKQHHRVAADCNSNIVDQVNPKIQYLSKGGGPPIAKEESSQPDEKTNPD